MVPKKPIRKREEGGKGHGSVSPTSPGARTREIRRRQRHPAGPITEVWPVWRETPGTQRLVVELAGLAPEQLAGHEGEIYEDRYPGRAPRLAGRCSCGCHFQASPPTRALLLEAIGRHLRQAARAR